MDFRNSFSREEAAVLVSGIVSMGLEILAGRIIAPEFGSTIYTWGSIIGVSMLALSLGYHYGGKNSTSISGMKDLEGFLIRTSGYILFIMYFGDQILSISSVLPVSSIYAPIIPITLLFGPPTYFLGFISPYAAQLSSKNSKGEASGHFYAVGTAGSILGAFGTTFLLIPNMSVGHIYILFAVLAALPLIQNRRKLRTYYPAIFLIAGILLLNAPAAGSDTLYRTDTAYQSLEVTRSDGVTKLHLDGQQQSAKYLNSTATPWDYPEYFYIPFLMTDDVENVLFIGGGGFVSPQQFAEKGVKVDAVELDPGVVRAAKEYFNLSESSNLSVHTMDGREYLEQTNKTYDIVVLDAFRKRTVPFHLTTKQFFQLVHQKTDEDGVVVSNVISTDSGPGSRFAKSYYTTIDTEFRSVYYFPTRDTSYAQNIEIIASKKPRISQEELLERDKNLCYRNLSSEITKMEKINSEDAQVLTDDYAPVEKLLNPLIGRKYVVN